MSASLGGVVDQKLSGRKAEELCVCGGITRESDKSVTIHWSTDKIQDHPHGIFSVGFFKKRILGGKKTFKEIH